MPIVITIKEVPDEKEGMEYLKDLEEECENLSEQNRHLVERIKEMESNDSKDAG